MQRPGPWLACLALAAGLVFGVTRWIAIQPTLWSEGVATSLVALLVTQWVVETLFAFGIAGTTALSLAYAFGRRPTAPSAPAPATVEPPPRLAILYLCCGDLDVDALRSLRTLRQDGPIELIVHDDLPGGDPAVDSLLASFAGDGAMPVRLLRRADKTGSKAGAVNHVLDVINREFDLVFMADNDSTVIDPDCLAALLQPLADPRVAVVQARNVKIVDSSCSRLNRIASSAIDVFDLFLTAGSRHAWMPFVGHNAVLRIAAVREVGGLLPGCFADDIDLTLRLNVRGHRVAYRRDVYFGERHPPSYAAFRKRLYKWACGSTQVLRRWLVPVLASRQMNLAEKWGFVQFLGFYALQALVLGYTAIVFLVAPLCLDPLHAEHLSMAVAGTVLPLLVFTPVLAYALRNRWHQGLGGFLIVCWLSYGATDFPTTRGVLHGLRSRMRRWVPTNSIRGGADRALMWEAAFGAALLLIPLLYYPALLLSPLAFLVAIKFLALPTIAELYQDGVRPVGVGAESLWPRVVRLLSPLLALWLVTAGVPAQVAPSELPRAVGQQLLVGGRPYVVRGIHYGPWRPGTGPGRSPYPTAAAIRDDMAWIAKANANTVMAFDVQRQLLDEAQRRDVLVLCGIWLDWNQFATPFFTAQEDAGVAVVRELADHPAVLGWVLGNEIPAWVVAEHGSAVVEQQLRGLRDRVRAIDAVRPITHANWPVTRSLDLSFLDIAAFNLYALWPPEVVAMGYGNYVRDVLLPIAGERPLLITEYGANSIEAGLAGQARLARECWLQLRTAGAIGGFVFEFADEWWKNYSNPRVAGSYWDRETALDDHLTHDDDPEEHYGLLTGERSPKPAYAMVQEMYASDLMAAADGDGQPRPRRVLELVVAGTVLCAALAFLAARQLRRRERPDPATEPTP